MRVFLVESVNKLGKAGDLVQVRDGYGRNFLIPRKLAIPVNSGTQKQVDEQKKHLTVSIERQEKRAIDLKEKLEQMIVKIAVQAGKDDKIFGAVTNQMIQKQLKDAGVILDRKKISLDNPIHKLGEYTVPAKLSSKTEATIRIKVVKA